MGKIKQTLLYVTIVCLGFYQSNLSAQVLDNTQQMSKELSDISLISVTIGGEFIVNGSFPASMNERVDDFITRVYNEYKQSALIAARGDESLLKIKNELEKFSQRGIILKRFDGSEIIIDLDKFRLTGDFSINPYLKNNDVLVFPPYDIETNFVNIDGAVNKPTTFQYLEGDKLSDAILFARGINQAFENVTTARISRLSYDGQNEDIIDVSVSDDFELQRGDRVSIVADESQRKDFKVLVLGEVNRPGYIYITKDQTTLKEAIDKAGGLRGTAWLENSELIRNTSTMDLLKKEYITKYFEQTVIPKEVDLFEDYRTKLETLLMGRLSNLTELDTAIFSADNKLRLLESKSDLDFTKINTEDSYESKFIVKNGDIILFPEKMDLVYVWGQVPINGYLDYVEGKNILYYVEKAGGLTEYAKGESDIVLIKGKTREWIEFDEDYIVEAGDYIYIPKDPPRTFGFYLSRVSSITGIIGGVATIILLIVQLGK